MAARFDHYVIVDWSAAKQPKTGRDSIWVCHRGPQGERCENPATRHLAKQLLTDIIAGAAQHGERMVLGFDFPLGYPAGFARRLGLKGMPWRAVWDEIAGLIRDDENNANNRFEIGALLNRRISGRPFPFWGCPAAQSGEFLGVRHHNGHEADGLAERRLIDRWMVGAQPCWKLAYTGSVGSQALTGIPVVRALRDDARWQDQARIWPFETGLGLSDDAKIVFAECWPSWWRSRILSDYGPPNDKAQVRSVAEIFAAADHAGELAGWFAGGASLSTEQRLIVETEEAWTLGVTSPKQRAAPQRAAPQRASLSMPASVTTARRPYDYVRDPAEIYRRSFELVEAETDLARMPAALRPMAIRLVHAAGDATIISDLAWSRGAVTAGRRALAAGSPVLVDTEMVAAGVARDRLPAGNPVICTLNEPAAKELAAAQGKTRSAAAVELWRPYLEGAVVAIGNAPTALFQLLELLDDGAPIPALVLGFPVGFVGAVEAKAALTRFGRRLNYVALAGRRGGSALAAAAVNALAAGKSG
jgi:precorrin-8X/cobalt-precorrin-8 methylmutase